ncbi:MAG: metallophosphoesterase family protein [Pseudomonadota bacterium]
MYSKIGIIGDVHAEHVHLQTAIQHLKEQGADVLLCTGDLADGEGDLDRCVDLLMEHGVRTVRGNHDRWLLQNKARHVPDAHHRHLVSQATVDFLEALPVQMTVPTSQGRLLLCHGMGHNDLQKIWPGTERMPIERCNILDNIIADADFNYIVNGHVHYRTLIHFQQLLLVNAGTLKRVHRPGFGLLDLDAQAIIGYELEPQVTMVRQQALAPCAQTEVFLNTQHFSGNWQPLTLYA